MDFYEGLDRVAALLQMRKRVTYGALKLQFNRRTMNGHGGRRSVAKC